MLTSQMGNIAFDIDRLLLLNILNDYYGLSQEKYGLSQEKNHDHGKAITADQNRRKAKKQTRA